jgi:ABC-2 type transport system permease protein
VRDTPPPSTPFVRSALASYTLARRELVRFLRQRNRVFGALAQPVIFWGIFGSGLSASFKPSTGAGSVSYSEYFFPGTIVLILLFTAIFATISIIEDRNEGFMQSVLVAPVPTSSIVMGKLVGTTVLAVGQGLTIFVLAPLAGIQLAAVPLLLAVPLLGVISFGLTGLGFTIAWHMDSTQGFHAIMTAFLMPMWFLSGAFFPSTGLPSWLGWIVALNPLTYGVAALRHLLYLHHPAAVAGLPSLGRSLFVICGFTAAMFAASVASARRGYTPA